jgi:hypothetical protein
MPIETPSGCRDCAHRPADTPDHCLPGNSAMWDRLWKMVYILCCHRGGPCGGGKFTNGLTAEKVLCKLQKQYPNDDWDIDQVKKDLHTGVKEGLFLQSPGYVDEDDGCKTKGGKLYLINCRAIQANPRNRFVPFACKDPNPNWSAVDAILTFC